MMSKNCNDFDWDSVFSGIRRRFDEVKIDPCRSKRVLNHVSNLQNWEADKLDYPATTPVFRDQVFLPMRFWMESISRIVTICVPGKDHS